MKGKNRSLTILSTLITLSVSCLALTISGAFIGSWFMTHDRRELISGVVLLITGFVVWAVSEFLRRRLEEKGRDHPRPVIHVWTHDGDTVVTTDKIYRISSDLTKEAIKASLPPNPNRIRVFPLIYAYRGERRCNPSLFEEELQAILDSCSIQKTEMGIPMGRTDTCRPVDFEKMWRLIHGPEAKPPKLDITD